MIEGFRRDPGDWRARLRIGKPLRVRPFILFSAFSKKKARQKTQI